MVVRTLLITIGLLSLIFGIIGLFLPVMPTVPFLLLSAYCFSRSSKTLHNWLINHRFFGRFVKSNDGIPMKTKIIVILFIWASIITSAVFIVKTSSLKMSLFFIGLFVTIIIMIQKTKTDY